MDSAISIASSVIQCLYDDTQNDSDVLHWIENFNNFETAISKWSKPQRKTLLHEYIQDQYLDAQNYVLDKHFVVDEIKGMQNLLEHYGVDYSYIGKVNVANLPFDEYTEELGEYADKLPEYINCLIGEPPRKQGLSMTASKAQDGHQVTIGVIAHLS